MKTFPTLVVLSLFLLAFRPPAGAGDYQGADAVLKQADAQFVAADDQSRPSNPTRQWREDLKRYQDREATLTPADAAQAWLVLFDRAVKLPASPRAQNYGRSMAQSPFEALRALPPPDDWDALADQVAARPPPEKGSGDFTLPVLRIIAGALQDKPPAVGQAIDGLKQQIGNLDGSQQPEYENMAQGLQEAFFTLTGDKQAALAQFEAKLAQLEPGADSPSSQGTRETLRQNDLKVPDLIALAGAPRAEALLKKLFALDLHGITVEDDDTKALARKVALEMGDQLRFAPWSLLDSLDSVPLYDALDKRFPNGPEDQSDRSRADAYHLLGLITLGRYEDANTLAVKIGDHAGRGQGDALGSLPEEALGDLAAKGYAGEVYKFFDRLLADHPELPYWHSYTAAAVLAGKTDAMLASVKAASERADLKPRAKSDLRRAYGEALLAADHVSEALPILREMVSAKKQADDGNEPGDGLRETALAAANLAGIGELLGDDALVNEQLDTLVELAKTQPDIVSNVTGPWREGFGEMFLSAKRGPDVERLLTTVLSRGEQILKGNLARSNGTLTPAHLAYYFQSVRSALYALTDLYYRAGRYEDIVALLDHASRWGAGDAATLSASYLGYGGGRTFLLQAARALQKTGNPAAALPMVNAYLDQNGGSDPAYVLLLELLPPDKAEARLDQLFRGDQFEERPLIWRASLQLGQGRLEEAEKSARQAISIDPSDGEEGRGDRMRAYAVLGDILERKGDAEKAAQMRRAVQAIRLSEDADRFRDAGLLTRAVAMYEQALGYFSDAYCIQSRLAIQLTALGKVDEAMVHYERAYELMPESFGRMESHCFGCERAFAGKRAQDTAEGVFQKFVDQQPTNPRVHYLLGYLRMEEDRKTEAAHEFGEAVKLDPDYINAWKQLTNTTDDPAVRNQAELNLLRLDPRRKHGGANLSAVTDLRALWKTVETAANLVPPAPKTLYPLAASAVFLEKQRWPQPTEPAPDEGLGESIYFPEESNVPFTPRAAILQNKVIAQALQFLPRHHL